MTSVVTEVRVPDDIMHNVCTFVKALCVYVYPIVFDLRVYTSPLCACTLRIAALMFQPHVVNSERVSLVRSPTFIHVTCVLKEGMYM